MTRPGVVGLPEVLEDLLLILLRDADARVLYGHRDFVLRAIVTGAYPDRTVRSELDRIGEEVQHDLLDLLPVAGQRRQVGRQLGRGREPRLLDERLYLGEQLADERRQLELLDVERHLSRFDAADVKQVVDDVQ